MVRAFALSLLAICRAFRVDDGICIEGYYGEDVLRRSESGMTAEGGVIARQAVIARVARLTERPGQPTFAV